jgi:DNA-binding NtrC family response regulator
VRELRNAIDRAVVSCLGDTILPEHLPPSLLKAVESRRAAAQAQAAAAPTAAPPASPAPPAGSGTLQSEIDAFEKARIIDTLERCGGNQSRAARMLGISRGTLIARLDAFSIARPRKAERASED